VAPLFWHAVAGLPGLLTMAAVDVLAERVRSTDNRYYSFGRAGRALAALMRALPARLGGALLLLAGLFVPTTRPQRGVSVWMRDSGKARPASRGISTAVLAGMLDLALAGPRRYPQRVVSEPWINQRGRARALPRDLRRGEWLLGVGALLNAILFLAIAVLWVWALSLLQGGLG
jgi:adenosylcobinamide-phosphate synthase